MKELAAAGRQGRINAQLRNRLFNLVGSNHGLGLAAA
jgi:hypothetical protein